ncbi:hypothetical protein, partial [Alcaligenes sp.]|uniref:hypothetical protein n=1 Tax=Alcaligenes sp. TaxID=512 RepID=UPI003D02963E
PREADVNINSAIVNKERKQDLMVSRAENGQPSIPHKEGRASATGEDEIDLVDLGVARRAC